MKMKIAPQFTRLISPIVAAAVVGFAFETPLVNLKFPKRLHQLDLLTISLVSNFL
jgi:hypothetical protein